MVVAVSNENCNRFQQNHGEEELINVRKDFIFIAISFISDENVTAEYCGIVVVQYASMGVMKICWLISEKEEFSSTRSGHFKKIHFMNSQSQLFESLFAFDCLT